MIKMGPKTLKEAVDNYILSTILGTYKTKRHWMKQGYDEDKAIQNALNYALGMLKENPDPRYAEIFREMAAIANLLADILERPPQTV